MKPTLHNKPMVPQGWLRVLLFCIFYLVLTVVAGLLLNQFPGKQAAPGNNTNGMAATPYLLFIIQAIISVAAVWLFRKIIDRRSFESMGFVLEKNGMHAGTGFFLGILLLCAGTCILFFSNHLFWTDISFNGNDLFISLGLLLIIAFYEEIVFRGYILGNLLESLNKWIALLISAVIFALAHISNPGLSVISATNIFLAGILLGLNFIYTKNLWFGIMLHFSWNFMQGPILGYDVSGLQLKSLLQHEVRGNDLLTGGKFGFEASLVATVLCVLAIGALIWVYEKKYTSWPSAQDTVTS